MKKIHPLYVAKRKTHFQNPKVATFSHVLSSRSKYKPKILYLWDSFSKVGTITRHSLVCYSNKESSQSGKTNAQWENNLRVPNSIEVSNFIVSKFYVIIAYRTILRENIGKYISPSTTTVLFCSSLPFFVYLSQVGLGNYQNKYSQNILVRNPFPTLKTFDPKISWETYNHLGYGDKLNLDQIEKVYHCPESVVIELNSNWFSQQNNNRVGFFKSNIDQTLKQVGKPVLDNKTLKTNYVNFDLWSYIPGRNLTSNVGCQLTVKENRLPWTVLFNNYDDIPSKLAPIFDFELTFKQLKLSLHKSSLHPVDNSLYMSHSKSDPKQNKQNFRSKGAYLNALDIVRMCKQITNQNDAAAVNIYTKKNNHLTFEKLNPDINFIALDSSYQGSKAKIKVPDHALKSIPLVNSYGTNLFNGLYENFPILGSRRLVVHNLFNSLALFGNQLALTSSSQVVTNQFDNKVCSINPEQGFVQRKQAFVYDLGLGSNFQGKGVRACKQFELRFFEQLKTYLSTSLPQDTEGKNKFSTNKYPKLLLEYLQSDSTQLLAFPMKYDFMGPETRITSNGVIKRKLSGYLHPDSSTREVYFSYRQANPLISVYNSMVQGKKQLKIDYGSNLSNRFSLINKFNNLKLDSALPKQNINSTLRLTDRLLGQKTTFTSKKQFTNRQMVKKYMRQRGELRLKSYTNSLPAFTISPIKWKTSKVNFKLPYSKVQRELAQFTTTLCSSNPRPTISISLAPMKFTFNQPYIDQFDPIIRIPWHSVSTPQLYKNHWNYTQFHNNNIANLTLHGEMPKSKKFVTELYEPITKHSWAILCQIGFVFIVSVLFNIVQREYRDELLNYIETLSIYLSSDDQAKIKNASVDQRYTVIRNSNYRFNTTVQNPQVLPKVADVILYLINTRHLGCLIPIVWQNVPGPCRDAFLSNSGDPVTPKGFLLVGPPGAGKTVFVKALAGEAGVALIMESGKNFHFELDFHGGDKLTKLFTAAKRIGPSLVFFDEIDIIGRSRTGVEAVHGEEYEARFPSVVGLPYESTVSNVHASNGPLDKNPVLDLSKRFNDYVELVPGSMFVNDVSALEKSLEKRTILNYREHINDVMLVTQLLSLMDGLTSREKVLIIGATDKPSILDPALTRPGRLDKVVYLDLPGRRKRFELFQFYSKVGTDESINWDYFAKLSMGLSAAHISAAMNWSLLKAIYNTQFKSYGRSSDFLLNPSALSVPVLTKKIAFFKPKRQKEVHHTFDTILHGIEMISSTSNQANGSWFKMAEKVNFKLLGHFNCSRLTSGPWVPFILNRSLFYHQLVLKPEHNKKVTLKYKPAFQVTADSNFQLKKGNLPQGQKENFQKPIGRRELYKKNRKYLRTLKYTSDAEFFANDKSTLNKVGSSSKYTDLLANQALTVVKRYFSRMMQSQTFGWHLLSESTINAKNTFFYQRNMDYLNQMVPVPKEVFHFSHQLQQNCKQISNIFQFHSVGSEFSVSKAIFYCQSSVKSLYRLNQTAVNEELNFNPSLNLIYYELLNLSLTHIQKKTGLKWKQHSLDLSYSLFQDDLYILRPAYYLSGQCLLNTILPNQIDHAQQFSLRSLIGSEDAQMSEIETSIFFKQLQEKLITKYQFECYLLVSLGGKIAETLMLVSNNSKNDSDLGIGQLKNAGSILTMMITKHLLFWPKQLLFEQDSITMNRNENNFPSQPERVVFQQLTRRYENRLQSGTFLPNSTETRAELIDHIQRPWWQFQALNSFSTNNTLRAKWYRFCLYNVIANEKNNMWLPAEKYYSNQTFQCFSSVNLLPKQNDTDLEFETFCSVNSASSFFLLWFYSNWDQFYLFLGVKSNIIFTLFYFYLESLTPRWENQVKFNHQNWNTIPALHKDVLIGNFIFELFNKPFGLLENNRQLLDSFAYKLLCFEKIGPTEIENAYSAYFDNSKPQWLVTSNELETIYCENILSTDEKNR